MQRKLAAILAADVVGYSRLIAEDEARTLDALRALRRELFEPLVTEHRGEVVKRMGDGWLVSFGSVVDAAACAIQVQERLAGHDRIKLRIGVHLGDIVHEDEDIYGDGVNIAARLQEVAEPGSVVLSGTAYESLVGRLDNKFHDAGEQTLKNIARPVRAWGWPLSKQAADTLSPSPDEPLALPDKPSIAVLPFVNMSNDPDQEFLADGIAEDVASGLSRFRTLFVIGLSATYQYKGEKPRALDIGRELGVRFVVMGTLRKSGERVRIAVEVTDTLTGTAVVSERFDGDLSDVFELQDRVTEQIVVNIAPEIEAQERERLRRAPITNLNSWELFQRGLWHTGQLNREDLAEGMRLLEQSIVLDPNQAAPHAYLAHHLTTALRLGSEFDEQTIRRGLTLADRALMLDPNESLAYVSRGRTNCSLGHVLQGLSELQTAVDLNPNSHRGHTALGWTNTFFQGRYEAAIPHFEASLRCLPKGQQRGVPLSQLAITYWNLGRAQEAIQSSHEAIKYLPKFYKLYANLAAYLRACPKSS